MILIMREKVRDYDAWKSVFDGGEPLRAEHGCSGHVIDRSDDDGNDLTVHLLFPTREAGEALRADPKLAANMERAGVETRPIVTWVHDGEALTYAAVALLDRADRSSTSRGYGSTLDVLRSDARHESLPHRLRYGVRVVPPAADLLIEGAPKLTPRELDAEPICRAAPPCLSRSRRHPETRSGTVSLSVL